MSNQLIISISREHGSGGRYIADILAEHFGLKIYDHNLLDAIAEEKGVNVKNLKKYDEAFKRPFLSRTVRGYNNSPEEALAHMQFKYLRNMAESGESFIVVGRCSETILSDFDCMITFFITADFEAKCARVAFRDDISAEEAHLAVNRHDRDRKLYHNHFSDLKWGDTRNYDICINSTRLGVEKTAELLMNFVERKLQQEENKTINE